MATAVMIMGASGSGKSASMRNFKGSELGVINVANKPLPFKSDINTYNTDRYEVVEQLLKKASVKSIVIDDSQYLMANELFDRSGEKNYEKFTDIAKNFRGLIHFINELDQDDKIVYFLHHTEVGADGKEKCKTIGKMLDEKLCVEGCFDIVLYCQDHEFYTQGNGISTAKTPEGLFDSAKIPNDLKAVDTAIRAYYGMGGD